MFLDIKYSWYGITKRTISSLLAIIQLSVCFTFLYFIINANDSVSTEVKQINSIFTGRYIYSINIKNDIPFLSSKNELLKLDKVSEYLKNNNVTHIAYEDGHINLQNFSGINKFMAPGGNNGDYTWVRCIDVDESFMENFQFEVNEGRNFKSNDFEKGSKESIPVILGPNYKEFFNVNDEIVYKNKYGNNDIRKLKIIGFLKNNYYFVSNKGIDTTINLDSYVIFPLQSIDSSIGLSQGDKGYDTIMNLLKLRYVRGSLIVFNSNDKAEEETIINGINNEVKKLSLQDDIELKDLTNKSETLVNNFNDSVREFKILVYMTMIFSAVGIICTSLSSIKKRFKEFGVHITYGCSIINISKRILYEILILTTIAFIISSIIIIVIHKNSALVPESIINWVSLTKVAVFSIALAVIISIPSIVKILKCEPVDLIKR
jgi:ABC-type antimicrobial peptide transport system permease subunit